MKKSAPSASTRRALDQLHDNGLNFDLDDRDAFTPDNGWLIDDYCTELPSEPPGPPIGGGSWETAVRLMNDYEFADPSIVRAVYCSRDPIEDRTMLLEGRFYGLRFLLGVRVGGINDVTRCLNGRDVRIWGWNYRTLEGHLEMGQMDYDVWKWMDTGEVEFRIHAFSKAAMIPNPIIRLGFAMFGRRVQKKFARRALERMNRLVREESSQSPRRCGSPWAKLGESRHGTGSGPCHHRRPPPLVDGELTGPGLSSS